MDIQYKAYTDKGYASNTYVVAAYSATSHYPLLHWQEVDNNQMKSVRIAAEWPFGKIVNEFQHIDFHRGQHI